MRQWNGRTMTRASPQLSIETDASSRGWGAFCQGEATGGCWSSEEQKLHINVLEMLAVFFALKAFLKAREGVSVLILSDNMSAPTMVPNRKGTDEGSERRGNDHSGHPTVENPTLVPFPPEHAGGSTNSITRHSRSDHPFPKLRLPSVGNSAPAGRMEGLRHHFRSKEIPNNAIELLMSSWRSKTFPNYNSAWRKWEGWCKQRSMHPFAADVPSILGFLADQFEEGRQYRSLNCYRSALSSTHLPVEGWYLHQASPTLRLQARGLQCHYRL